MIIIVLVFKYLCFGFEDNTAAGFKLDGIFDCLGCDNHAVW